MSVAPPSPSTLAHPARAAVEDDDAARRQALLGRLRDDRRDLVRIAVVVRELAETFEVAQGSLAIIRRSLRWLALVGGVAALTLSLRTGRRPPALLLTGLSLYLVQRWLSHPVRRELAAATQPVVVGPVAASSVRRYEIAPPAASGAGR